LYFRIVAVRGQQSLQKPVLSAEQAAQFGAYGRAHAVFVGITGGGGLAAFCPWPGGFGPWTVLAGVFGLFFTTFIGPPMLPASPYGLRRTGRSFGATQGKPMFVILSAAKNLLRSFGR